MALEAVLPPLLPAAEDRREVASTLTSPRGVKTAAMCSYVFMKTITRSSAPATQREELLPVVTLEGAGS